MYAYTLLQEPVWPLYSRALLHDSDTTLTALPEKHHTFRPPHRRAPTVVSLVFTALVLAPLVAFAALLQRLSSKSKSSASSTGSSSGLTPWRAAYLVCIAAVLALFGLYWLRLTMAVALQVLAPLAIVTAAVGRQALRGLDEPSSRSSRGVVKQQ
jgi:oligosaccharyltransferase complex subunit delta (ribophorin II)